LIAPKPSVGEAQCKRERLEIDGNRLTEGGSDVHDRGDHAIHEASKRFGVQLFLTENPALRYEQQMARALLRLAPTSYYNRQTIITSVDVDTLDE